MQNCFVVTESLVMEDRSKGGSDKKVVITGEKTFLCYIQNKDWETNALAITSLLGTILNLKVSCCSLLRNFPVFSQRKKPHSPSRILLLSKSWRVNWLSKWNYCGCSFIHLAFAGGLLRARQSAL